VTTENENTPVKVKRKSYLLHMDQDLWQGLQYLSKKDSRTVNSMILHILHKTVDPILPPQRRNFGQNRY